MSLANISTHSGSSGDVRISAIIPAANEEGSIARAIRALEAQTHAPLEIIVVVNGSHDSTARMARESGATTIVFDELLGPARARNEGARLARGNMLVFLDADSYPDPHVLAHIAEHAGANVFGTVRGAPDSGAVRYRIFFAWKNVIHRLRLFRGMLGGLLFFDASLFQKIGGYDEDLIVSEHADLISRARAAGGVYRYVSSCTSYTSMRRFDHKGLLSALFFWCFVFLFWRKREMRTRIGTAYASSHANLFEVSPSKLAASICTFCVSAVGVVCGALVLFASYYGPTAFVRDLFSEKLASDPSTPIIDTMLYVAALSRFYTLVLFGAVLLVVSAIALVRSFRGAREYIADELALETAK